MNYRLSTCRLASILLLLAGAGQGAIVSAQALPAVQPDPQAESISRPAAPAPPDKNVLLAGATKIDGMIPLYLQGQQLYAVLSVDDLDTDLLLLISIARGIAQRPLVGGATWQFGNDWVCQFRRVGEAVHFVRRNVRYRAQPGTPAARAVQQAYSDSVLASLPILATDPAGGLVVELTPIFLSDLPGVSLEFTEFQFDPQKSSWADVQGFAHNLELQVAATYSSAGLQTIETLEDSRWLTVTVHYSLSRLPASAYRPRRADDRIGYFVTVSKDYTRTGDQDRFARLINRWHLTPEHPSQALSRPVEPIVFWLENTIPYAYRDTIREGILEWNKVFEKIGFQDALEVRQQPEDATWQPGDVRYNTFRWITSGLGVAAGPSRVNPITGQILDADITFDADFLQLWKRRYENFSRETIVRLTGGPLDLEAYRRQQSKRSHQGRAGQHACCDFAHGFAHQFALSATVMACRRDTADEFNKLTQQALKKVAMHEVGHTLGLRHNFKASTLYTVAEIQQLSLVGGDVALSASVMDYLPANLAALDQPQGCYYSSSLGPYDYWAIEYGYRPLPVGLPEHEEQRWLDQIAAASGAPGHAFATDEETRGIDADPQSGRFDYGRDILEFAKTQANLVAQSWPDLVDRVMDAGAGYEQVRQALGVLMITHGRAMFAAARHVGGIYSSRSHRGDSGAPAPQEVVCAAQQRRALDLLSRHLFSDQSFPFAADFYGQLGVSRWNHWGSEMPARADFPVHQAILLWQDRILEKLLSPLTLTRLYDSERQIPADQDAFTVAELLERLTASMFSDLPSPSAERHAYTNRQPALSSHRRSLQSVYLDYLLEMASGLPQAPSDCQALALLELTRLQRRIEKLLQSDFQLDRYTLAHLTAVTHRIRAAHEGLLATGHP